MQDLTAISHASFLGYPYIPDEISGNAIDLQSFSFARLKEFLYASNRSSASPPSPPLQIGPTA